MKAVIAKRVEPVGVRQDVAFAMGEVRPSERRACELNPP